MIDPKNLNPLDSALLICPRCGAGDMRDSKSCLACGKCGREYRKEGGRVFFTEDFFDVDDWESRGPEFDILKRGAAQHSRIDRIGGPRIRDLRSYVQIEGVALNLGGGADDHDGFVNVDLGRYPNVHIVADLQSIPYRDSSVGLVVSNSVLEHIYDYATVVSEIHRVLRPGGFIYLCVPSVCMRHHEHDFHRWTVPGLLSLLQDFVIVEHGFCRGVAYSLCTLVEALIVHKTRPGALRELLRRSWLLLSRPLYWIEGDDSPEYAAMSQTIYAIARKKEDSKPVVS